MDRIIERGKRDRFEQAIYQARDRAAKHRDAPAGEPAHEHQLRGDEKLAAFFEQRAVDGVA